MSPNERPMKSLRSRLGIGDVLAVVGHEVGQRAADDVVVARVRADEVGIVHPEVVDRLAGLNLDRDLVDDQAFIHHLVVDLNAGDLGEGLGQGLRFVFVDAEDFRGRADLHALERRRRLDEPFHLGHLLVFAQGRRLKLAVDPFLGRIDLLGIGGRGRDDRRPAHSRRRGGDRRRALQYVTTLHVHCFLP